MAGEKGPFHDLRLIILLVVALLCILAFRYLSFAYTPLLHTKKTDTYIVQPGADLKSVIYSLKDRGWVSHAYFYYLFARWHGFHDKLRYGEYRIAANTSTLQFLKEMAASKSLVQHSIRLGEGWTFPMVRRALAYDHRLRHVTRGKSDREVMVMLGYPDEKPEGRFFPDTYVYTWGNTDLSILRAAYLKMQSQLKAVKKPYRTLIIASMIEKEAGSDAERPVIAGVIENRLHKQIPLQIDATVRYALSKPPGEPLSKRDLKTHSPFNTYLHYGLPPTPIAAPSASAITAAAHPKKHQYLYYVAVGDGEGHRFSKDYAGHLKAVAQYRRRKVVPPRWYESYQIQPHHVINFLIQAHYYIKWVDRICVGMARGRIN